jgi:hypothetical protein
MTLRSYLFLAVYIQARRSRRLYLDAMADGVSAVKTRLGMRMSRREADRILVGWKFAARRRGEAWLPELVDDPSLPVKPAAEFMDPVRQYRCVSSGHRVRIDPETIGLLREMALDTRRGAKARFGIAVKSGKLPVFPRAKPRGFGKKARAASHLT